MKSSSVVATLAQTLNLGALLAELVQRYGAYDVVAHWTQGEFHHDVVLRLGDGALADLPGRVLVVATNCNGGVKEVLCLGDAPDRGALWHHRCPEVSDFQGPPPAILAHATTEHWFDPCELLAADARSELKPECRQRQHGGGWEPLDRAQGTRAAS